MRPFLLIILFVFIGLSVSFPGEQDTDDQKYAEAKELLETLADHIESFVDSLNHAEKAADIAISINDFTEPMKEIIPALKEIMVQFPEIRDQKTHPETLKSVLQRLEKSLVNMMKAYKKVNLFLEDPEVVEADNNYKKVMSGLR